MSRLHLERSVVVIIDMQGKLMEIIHRPELVVAGTERLLRLADLFRVPVVLTEQYPKGLGPTHAEIREVFEGLETESRRLSKTSFGCCGEPAFEEALGELRPGLPARERQLVLAGIEAHVCVMQTALGLLEAGSEVHLCWECVSGRGEEYRRHALDRMQQAGAVLSNHESVGFEWALSKEHPAFSEMSRIFREGQIG